MPREGGATVPHFGQHPGWQARQNARPQPEHGAKPAGMIRCSASSHTRRGRSAEALHSHIGGSSRRASGFQSSWTARSALRRRTCTVKGVIQNPPFLGYTRRAETAGL